jgi:hypothetical protein
MGPPRQTRTLALSAIFVAAVTLAACSGDAWLEESNPSRNHLFDPQVAREVRSFWYVSAPQIDVVSQMLETRPYVSISPERAALLIGRIPDVPAGDSLYLVRAIDVADPTPLHIYLAGAWVEVNAGTRSACFLSRPPMKRQPIVVALPQVPTRLRLSYYCNG